MTPIQVLLLCGGGSAEHDVSLRSAEFLNDEISKLDNVNVIRVEMTKEGEWKVLPFGESCRLQLDRKLIINDEAILIDYVVPCIHGYPGETGDIQSFLTLADLPFLGCDASSSILCFNKISTKLWFDALSIPNTPYIFLSDNSEMNVEKVESIFDEWGSVFVKAACQGSSVGCYKVTDKAQIRLTLAQAFQYSEQVLVEKSLVPRELEIAVYEYQGEIVVTMPAEILCPSDTFYTFDEKYSPDSHSLTTLTPKDLTQKQIDTMQALARKAFVKMKLKDLSRVDFFLTPDGEILLNEINTFPGMTQISMFPKLLQYQGHIFAAFMKDRIFSAIANKSRDAE